MPFHLLKSKSLTKSSALKGAAFGFVLVLCFQNIELWAQNFIINPSFENFNGIGNPCSDYTYVLPNGGHTRRVPLVDFTGWKYGYHATINCKECTYIEGSKRFSIYPYGSIGGTRYLNNNQLIIKGDSAYHGTSSGQLDQYIGLTKVLNWGKLFGYEQSHYLGTLKGSVKKDETYYFSVWLSPVYADIVRKTDGRKQFYKTNFQLSSFVFDLVDTLVEGHSQPFNLLSMDDATYINPRKNIIEGNADSNWVELRFTFTANKTAKNFAFGFIVNAYDEDDYFSENPYFYRIHFHQIGKDIGVFLIL